MSKIKKQLLAGPYLIWIIGFIILPLFMIVYYAFKGSDGGFTFEYVAAIAQHTNIKALLLSLRLGIICTIICLVLSYPLAMILNGLKIKNQSFVVFVFMLPMWMNFMLRILAWKQLLSKNGVINSILTTLGLPGFNIMNTSGAVVLGMVYDFLPFMLLPIYNSMTRIKNDWIEAALDLGANKVTIFFKIILPLTISGVISGIVMVFVPSLTSFAISQILGGGKVLLIGMRGTFLKEFCPGRRHRVRMAGRELLEHGFGDFLVDFSLTDKLTDDFTALAHKSSARFEAMGSMFGIRLGAKRGKNGHANLSEAFEISLHLGIGRAAVDPEARDDEVKVGSCGLFFDRHGRNPQFLADGFGDFFRIAGTAGINE